MAILRIWQMKKTCAVLALVLLGCFATATAQETYFGKNKVRYRNFDWNYIQTRHFDLYFYDDAYPLATFAADVMEKAYKEISGELHYNIQQRVPVFIYNSHNEFQQTNIISSLLPEGVGGFTEAFKNRIVIPFTGSYEDFRHVLHHELTHAVIYNMLFGNSLASILSRQRLFDLPTWFAEGYAEYSSRHGWDYESDMWMRDATINGYLIPPLYLTGYPAYRQGQAMIKYIVDKYGEDKLHQILQKGKIYFTMSKAMKEAIGIDEEKFWDDFSKEMKRRYWPSLRARKEADEIGKALTKAREDGSYFNEKPIFSPDGDKIAMFTDKSDYTEIVLISPYDGKVLKRLVKAERSGDLESLHSYVSGMSFSPDGRSLVFVAKSGGDESICFVDVAKGDITRMIRMKFKNILSPAWSPDGKKIAFSALQGVMRDLYVYDIESGNTTRITDDRYDDVDPNWLANSSQLLFASDRPHPGNTEIDYEGHPYVNEDEAYRPGDFRYGDYNLFRVDVTSKHVDPLNVGTGQNVQPRISPGGDKLAFISNRNGIDNLYIGYLDSTANYAVTDILTGVRDFSWSPDGKEIVYSAFFKGAYDVFLLKDLVPAGDKGVLAETDFVLGKYDVLPKAKSDSTAKADTTAAPDAAQAQQAVDSTEAPHDSTMVVYADTTVALATVPDTTTTTEPAADTTAAPAAVDSTAAVVAAVTDSTKADTSLVAAASTDTTKLASTPPDSTGETADTTGIYGDEYVFVGNKDTTGLEGVLTEIHAADSLARRQPLPEPEYFDSIQPYLPSGEYKIHKYKVKFTTDYVGGNFSYDTFFGLSGQTYFVFSDYLGNHQILIAADLVNSIDQSFIQGYYFNNKKRTNLGIGFFHTKNYYEDNNNYLFSDRFYGVQGFASRPFSTFNRVQTSLGQFFIDRKYYDRAYGDLRENRSSKVTTGSLSLVFDNVLWGYTGPVNGKRYILTLDGGVNAFDKNDISFYSASFDYRKYWHIAKTFSMAFRMTGGASFGSTPKQYFLGGTTNWIGSRTLDASVYDVENLYFANVVTPLRGQEYYGLSGTRYGLINWEFRFPMVALFAMRYPLPIVLSNVTGAIFTDIGSAWYGSNFKGGTSEGGRKRLNDIKAGFGFGARVNLLGIVLLRYDLAWATDGYTVSAHPTSYFSLGADF